MPAAVTAARARTIDHCGVPASNRRRSTNFYGKVLRGVWEHEHEAGTFFEFGRNDLAVFFQRELVIPQPARLHDIPRWAFVVAQEDFPQIVRDLSRLPIPFEGPVRHPTGPVHASVYFVDSEGNNLEICHRAERKVGDGPWQLLGVDHVDFETTDLDRALRFYEGALGADVVWKGEDEEERAAAHAAVASGQYIGLHEVGKLSEKSTLPFRGQHVAFFTGYDEYDAIIPRIDELGGHLEGDAREAIRTEGEKSIYFTDPDGNRFQITAPAPLAAPGGHQ